MSLRLPHVWYDQALPWCHSGLEYTGKVEIEPCPCWKLGSVPLENQGEKHFPTGQCCSLPCYHTGCVVALLVKARLSP